MNDELDNFIEQIKSETNAFNKAKLLLFLNRDKQIRINQLAKLLGFHPSYICHLMRLLSLPEIIVDGYYTKNVSLSHLFVISRFKDTMSMTTVYEKVLTENLTVIQTEELVRNVLYGVKTEGERLDTKTTTTLQEKIKKIDPAIEVSVIQTRIRSKVTLLVKGSLSKTTKILQKLAEEI